MAPIYNDVMLAALTMILMAALFQTGAIRNPREGNPDAIRTGATLYAERCAECHGADAKGVRGPDLTRLWTSASSDSLVFQKIRSGVPGSIMPPSSAPDDELWAIAAFLRSTSTVAPGAASSGNVENGARIFSSTCGSCHWVNGRGGHLGPDLSQTASSRSRAELTRAIREASASIAAEYQAVTIVTREGTRVRGARKSEDAYSIQLMDTRERLQGYVKTNLREVVREPRSLMPDFGPDKLNDRDLDDLLQFLSTLRAPASGGPR